MLALLTFLCAFLLGGSSRDDMAQLVVLWPASAILLLLSLWDLRRAHLFDHKYIVGAALSIAVFLILALVPLPPVVWHSLPGRETIVVIDEVTGLEGVWRPLSMAPDRALSALFAFLLPSAMLLFLAQLDDRSVVRLLPAVAAIVGLTAIAGYLQALGGSWSLYSLSNANSGLFANRNHQALAIACLVPMIAVLAARKTSASQVGGGKRAHKKTMIGRLAVGSPSGRLTLGLLAILTAIPLVFVAGSRAGLALTGLSLVVSFFLVSWQSAGSRRRAGTIARAFGYVVVSLIGLIAIAWALFLSDRDVALQRLFAKDLSSDIRFPIWEKTWELAVSYLPFGSGPGSFVEVYQIAEPHALLQEQYINNAHNDFLEIFLTSGIFGAALIIAGITAFFICLWRTYKLVRTNKSTSVYRALGLLIIGLCAASSAVDYPLRSPALACLFVYAIFLACLKDVRAAPVNQVEVQ